MRKGDQDMKKVWKWVIGIAVALVVVAALVGGAFLLRNHFANVVGINRSIRPGVQLPGNGQVPGYGWEQRGRPERFPGMMPFDNNGWGGYGMHMRGPGMMGFGRRMPFAGLVACLFSLGFLALVVLGIIWLVRRQSRPAVAAAPVAPVESVAPVAAVHPCSKCGEPVQEGWKHCPNCGKRQ
jgi:hypothetical protein